MNQTGQSRFSQNKHQLKTTTWSGISGTGERSDSLLHFLEECDPFPLLTTPDDCHWPGGKAQQFLCNPLQNTKAEWQLERSESRLGGKDGVYGRATFTNVGYQLTYWMAVSCQVTESVGGRKAACFRLRLEQTRSLCRHTPPHTPFWIAQRTK